MATKPEERCAICLDSWEEASYMMPCLHRFCYPCILRWSESNPKCPLCKRRILSLLHLVQADDDFMEHVITTPPTSLVIAGQARADSGHTAAHALHHPGAPQPWTVEGVPRNPVGGLQAEEWVSLFESEPVLLEILLPWLQESLRQIFRNNQTEAATVMEAIVAILMIHGMDEELLAQMLRVFLQNHTVTFVQQFIHVAVQRCSREARRLLDEEDARAAGGWEGSLADTPRSAASQEASPAPGPAPSGSPARSSEDELLSTSSAAVAGDPGSHPSVPVAMPVEHEELLEEPGEAVPGSSTSIQGSERCPRGPRRPPERSASSSKASPANKRPA